MSPTKSKVTLLILLAVFILPMYFASQLYYSRHDSIPKPLNRGTLLNPMIPFAGLEADHPLERHWTMVQIQMKPCEDQCKKNLYKMNQVWLSLGADQDRVNRSLVTIEALKTEVQTDFVHASYPRLQLLLIPEKKLQSLRNHGDLFIVDPLGNIMLAYSETAPPDDIYADLKRLLSVSQIG